jgi:hypothetical protein
MHHDFATGIYKNQLDRLVATDSSQTIADGQRFANSFVPQLAGVNAVEADLKIAQLKLTAIFGSGDELRAAINQTIFKIGDIKEVSIDSDSARLLCLGIQLRSAQLQIQGTRFSFNLRLGN